ncbi:MAG: helix-turn-helix transcriptional regulator [Eubacteriales bacterium]|nr:helix-turn-helix transcriptional regulator [Eubacteriales bacterium]
MERGYIEGKENIYLACRKRAAEYNDKLNSREMAAELLGFSTSTLANYELGVTKNVPPDSVVMMSDLYRQPELKNYYCKHECPIGKNLPMATKESGLQGITVKILNSLDDEEIKGMKKSLLSIAADGEITPDEQDEFDRIVKTLETLEKAISELRILAEKYQK